jgi:hypothetical protein
MEQADEHSEEQDDVGYERDKEARLIALEVVHYAGAIRVSPFWAQLQTK